jgi:hypothetical protein
VTYLPVPGRASGDLFTETMWDRYVRDNQNRGVLRPIADTLLGSSAASVTFASIPADWENLLVVVHARGDAATSDAGMRFNFNDDASASYYRTELTGDGAAVNPGQAVAENQAYPVNFPCANVIGNYFAGGVVLIAGATGAGSKWIYGMSTNRTAAPVARVLNRGVVWDNIAAVSKIVIAPTSGNFVVNSRFTLYGLGGR